MNEFNFIRRCSFLAAGDGFRKHDQVRLDNWRDANGLVLTAATVPHRAALETSFLGVIIDAGQTAGGSLNFVVPEDYDYDADELRLRFLAGMSASNDTTAQKITGTMYVKRAKIALATKTGVASGAVPQTATAATAPQWVEIKLDANSLRPGDAVTIVFTVVSHTTDTVNVYGLEMFYRSNLAFTNIDNNASDQGNIR